MSAGKFVLGAMVAMAAGAVLGVLFAPDKGENTRRRLSRRGARYVGDLKNTASGYLDTLEGKIEDVSESAVNLTDRVKDAVNSIPDGESQKRSRRS